jgi:hypothetical protein
VILILHKYLRFLLPKRYSAITLWPFIVYRSQEKASIKTINNHERIHLKQQLELLILPFYIIYLIEYLINLFYYFKHDKAYRSISFEKEAFSHDQNIEYLKTRKRYAMWR